MTEEYRELLQTLSDDVDVDVRKTVALTISMHFKKMPGDYQRILREFVSDTPVMSSLKGWIKENEKYEWQRKTIEALKRELNL